jgi:DNA polymerase III delta subunit
MVMIIFIYGEDNFRTKKKICEFKDKFLREVDKSGGSIEQIEGKTADLKQINEKSATASLLASKRMIIIEDIFSNKNKELLPAVAEYFSAKEKNNWGNIVIFFDNSIKSKRKMGGEEVVKADSEGRDKPLGKKEKELFDFLFKQKFAQELKKLSVQDQGAWIKNEVELRGGAISSRAIQAIIALVGYDLWQIDREIDKLINFKRGENPPLLLKEGLGGGSVVGAPAVIESEDVEQMVKGSFDDNIFALTDAIGARNKALSAKLLEEQFELGANGVYLLVMITRQIKIILQVRQALDLGLPSRQIISELKQNPYVVQKAIEQARHFSLNSLKIIFDKLVEIDFKIKTGQGEPQVLLNLLLARL